MDAVTVPDDLDPTPLDLAHRHLAAVTGLAVGVESLDPVASNARRREQMEHVTFAAAFAALSQADSLARIAVALERITGPQSDTPTP